MLIWQKVYMARSSSTVIQEEVATWSRKESRVAVGDVESLFVPFRLWTRTNYVNNRTYTVPPCTSSVEEIGLTIVAVYGATRERQLQLAAD